MTDLRKLFQQTAEALSGRVVLIRFRKPVDVGAFGETYKVPSGLAIIDINPELGWEHKFNLLLHEAAHVKLHLDGLLGTSVVDLPPASIVVSSKGWQARARDPREQEAEELAEKWEATANEMEAMIDDRLDRSKDSEEMRVWTKLVCLKTYFEVLQTQRGEK